MTARPWSSPDLAAAKAREARQIRLGKVAGRYLKVLGRRLPFFRMLAGEVPQWRGRFGDLELVITHDPQLRRNRWHRQIDTARKLAAVSGDHLEEADAIAAAENALLALGVRAA